MNLLTNNKILSKMIENKANKDDENEGLLQKQ